MNRRITAIFIATAALTLVPAAAMAYDAPGYATTITDPTPAVGQAVTLTTTGTTSGASYTLTCTSNPSSLPNSAIEIAGTKALSKTATGTSVSWAITLRQGGTFTCAVTDASGALVGDEVMTVVAAGSTPSTGSLASTGFDAVGLAAGAGVLMLAGLGAVLVARRRQGDRVKA